MLWESDEMYLCTSGEWRTSYGNLASVKLSHLSGDTIEYSKDKPSKGFKIIIPKELLE